MDASPLNKLPYELRLTIYEYALCRSDCEFAIHLVNIQPVNKDNNLTGKIQVTQLLRDRYQGPEQQFIEKNLLALLHTCRVIAVEARPAFYAMNHWSFRDDQFLHQHNKAVVTQVISTWLRERGGKGRQMFRAMHICAWLTVAWWDEADQEAVARDVYERYMCTAACFDETKTSLNFHTGPTWRVGVDMDRHIYPDFHDVWLPMRAELIREAVGRYMRASMADFRRSRLLCAVEESPYLDEVEIMLKKLHALLWYIVGFVEGSRRVVVLREQRRLGISTEATRRSGEAEDAVMTGT